VVDICPVGALTSRDFRFRARVWYLERTESVCGACGNGCNIEIYHREGRIYRFQPRENQAVNQFWMCDEGRLSYRDLQGEGRLTRPIVRGMNEFTAVTWADAIAPTIGRLRDIAREHGPGSVGVIVSAQAPNEEIFLARRLADSLGARLAGISWSPANAFHDDFLIKADKNPNTQGLRLQGVRLGGIDELLAAAAGGQLKALVVLRTDLTNWCDGPRARAALENVPCLIVLDTHQRETAQFADTVLPIGTYAESDGTFTNHAGRVQRFWAAVPTPEEARPGWRVLAELLAAPAGERPYASAEAVFADLARSSAAFRGLDYGTLGCQGAPATAAATASANG
jgi:NADH-quinone oxidoreductase subunit G